MDAKVKEFLEKAQANEREKFEKERDALLISLGLIEGDAVSGREYGPRYGHPYVHYDAEKKAYYREIKGTPISVTDEEYEMIKKIRRNQGNSEQEGCGCVEKWCRKVPGGYQYNCPDHITYMFHHLAW